MASADTCSASSGRLAAAATQAKQYHTEQGFPCPAEFFAFRSRRETACWPRRSDVVGQRCPELLQCISAYRDAAAPELRMLDFESLSSEIFRFRVAALLVEGPGKKGLAAKVLGCSGPRTRTIAASASRCNFSASWIWPSLKSSSAKLDLDSNVSGCSGPRVRNSNRQGLPGEFLGVGQAAFVSEKDSEVGHNVGCRRMFGPKHALLGGQ